MERVAEDRERWRVVSNQSQNCGHSYSYNIIAIKVFSTVSDDVGRIRN